MVIAQINRKNQQQVFFQLYEKADKLYKEGEDIANHKYYTEEKEIQLNREALKSFQEIEKQIESCSESFDSLLFFIHFKKGVLEHYFENYEPAKVSYLKAIRLKNQLSAINDSFLFKPYLYFGIILYHENLFDSALHIYQKAENIAAAVPTPLKETERLYNTLGALFYETGNYRQAKNYFLKAMAVLPVSNPYYRELMVNYKINLASIYTKLEAFDEANKIYQEILPLQINRDIILHNKGVINLRLGAINTALDYFRKVNYSDNRRIRLYNDFAQAFINSRKYDSAQHYILLAEHLSQENKTKTVARGQTNLIWGDLLLLENKPREALEKYQQAIINFYPGYHENVIEANPEKFNGIFSFIQLFTALTSKAEAFSSLYAQKNEKAFLIGALSSYQSAFLLAEYVEKNYDSDEARLFLNNIKYSVHSKPITISIQLYKLTRDKKYLEAAWQFDQKNKASLLTYHIQESEIRNSVAPDVNNAREKELKSQLTRLSLKANQENDSLKFIMLNDQIRDKEIELGKIQEKINFTTAHKNLHPPIPSIEWIKNKMLDDETTLLSFHLSEKEILVFSVNRSGINYAVSEIDVSFFNQLDSFSKSLHQINSNEKFDGISVSKNLYSILIDPILPFLKKTNRLIIIPDDELNYIPFEALQNVTGEYLSKKFSVQYQYSASLLRKSESHITTTGILSFAPFAAKGNNIFNRLSNSSDEIKDLKGKSFFDQEATKENFLSTANKFPVIHLATHAIINDQQPLQSFIAFSSFNQTDTFSQRLYAREIYNLGLDSTRLVILSACETGTGQLVHGEGLMSLSRAFSYAGCPDIVTSLWKAEDKTTAYITKRFHFYLNKKITTDKALQLAKADMLESTEIDERFKTPNYWAHLIFIGEYEPGSDSFFRWWHSIVILLISGLLFWIIKVKKNQS